MSPKKEIWFKFYHVLKIIDMPLVNLSYSYETGKAKYYGDDVKFITFDELKEILKDYQLKSVTGKF